MSPSSPYIRALPFGRRHGLGCDCAECGSKLGADPIPPATPPAGPWADVQIPPPEATVAVRGQAAEVFRRAVWDAAGPTGWDDEARAAWLRIATLPAMPSYSAQPGAVTDVVAGWLRKAIAQVPTTWTQPGSPDPRGAAVGAMSTYASRVLAQLDDTFNPWTLYKVGVAWRAQALADKAAGLYDRAADAAREGAAAVRETIENAAPGLGFGAVLGAGVLLAGAAFLVAPEAATTAAYRAGRGVKSAAAREGKR